MLGLSHPWARFQFDRAVFSFGNHVEARLQETDNKGKKKWTAEQVLRGDADRKASITDLFLAGGQSVMGF